MNEAVDSGTALRIAIIEDNKDLCDSLQEALSSHGHKVVTYACAEDLDTSTTNTAFDLALLDLNLPGENGLSLAKRLKRLQPTLRVIMMTTRGALHERIEGYEAGADLYLPKPLNQDELMAAVTALSRQIQSDAYKLADARATLLNLDAKTMVLRGTHGVCQLNAADVALLTALARAPGQQLEHGQLMEALGLPLDETGKANLAVRITRLRAKFLQVSGLGQTLKSLRLEGYRLCATLQIQ